MKRRCVHDDNIVCNFLEATPFCVNTFGAGLLTLVDLDVLVSHQFAQKLEGVEYQMPNTQETGDITELFPDPEGPTMLLTFSILLRQHKGMNSSHLQHHNISREDLGGLFRPDEFLPQLPKRHLVQ